MLLGNSLPAFLLRRGQHSILTTRRLCGRSRYDASSSSLPTLSSALSLESAQAFSLTPLPKPLRCYSSTSNSISSNGRGGSGGGGTSIPASSTPAPTAPRATATAATTALPSYSPPTKGIISCLPLSWQPYAELSRLDKPAGALYLFFPCVFSTLLAASSAPALAGAAAAASLTPSLLDVVSTTSLFLAGAFIMRGAGCTINDLWDRNFDPLVARTRLRPIARGAVSPARAFAWFNAQCVAGLAVLLQFPHTLDCVTYAVPSLVLVATYPLAKRVTHYPQFVLGLAFSWGALVGFPAMGVDLLASAPAAAAAAALYASCVAWTLVYDMIYAYMDIRDDVKAGVKSIALRHQTNPKPVLSALAAVQVGLLAVAGVAIGASPIYFVGACGTAAATLTTMILRVDLASVENCWWWFRHGCWLTGGGIASGLFAEYIAQSIAA